MTNKFWELLSPFKYELVDERSRAAIQQALCSAIPEAEWEVEICGSNINVKPTFNNSADEVFFYLKW